VRDKNEYITNMGKPDVARIKRDADVATAEADRDTAISARWRSGSGCGQSASDRSGWLAETLSLANKPKRSAI